MPMSTSTPDSTPDGQAAPESFLDTLRGIWRELPGLVSDRVELLSLELQRAGMALVQIALLGIALAVLGITAWLLLWGLVIATLALAGLHWTAAFLLALAVHLLLLAWVVQRVRTLFPVLGLPATRRHLTFPSPPVPMASPPPAPEDAPTERAPHERAPSVPSATAP